MEANTFKHAISPTYHDLLTYGLQQGCLAATLPDPIHSLQDPHCTVYLAQQELGWTQLYYGRMLPAWVTVQNAQYPTTNGLHYYVKVQTTMASSLQSMATMEPASLPSTSRPTR